jgi:hypothetical protein
MASATSDRDGGARMCSEVTTQGEFMVASQVPARSQLPTVPLTARIRLFTVRLRTASPVIQGLVALAIYLIVWVVAEAFPLLAHPAQPQLDQLSMDPNFFTWILRWWPYAIAHGLNPFYTTEVGAPTGHALEWVTMIPSLALPAAPLTLAAGPVVSFNLLVVASIPVSAWAAFVLCRRLTGQFWPALAGGTVFGFSAYELNHIIAGQLNLAYSLLLPLMAYLVVVWWQRGMSSARFVGLLAVAMVLQFYLSIETFAEMTFVWAFALAVGYALAGRPYRQKIAQLGLLAGIGYLIALICVLPFLAYAINNRAKGFGQTPIETAVDLVGFVMPRAGQTFGWGWLARYAAPLSTAGQDGYVGIPLLVLAAAFAITGWSRKITRFLIVMILIVALVTLGPILHIDGHKVYRMPWKHLWMLPVVHSAYPARLMVFVFLALAVMVALWLARPARWPWPRWLLALLAIAAIAANTPALTLTSQPGSPAFVSTAEYQHYLAPGSNVVVISGRGNAGMLWQAETDFRWRLAGGYLGSLLARQTDLPVRVADLASSPLTPQHIDRFWEYVAAADVTTILVEASSAGQWPAILGKLGLRGRLIGGVIVYRIVA